MEDHIEKVTLEPKPEGSKRESLPETHSGNAPEREEGSAQTQKGNMSGAI
jgi:hypothetical protein